MPTISFFSYHFTSYAFFASIGLICCVLYCLWQCKRHALVMDDMINILAYSFIGAMIGAKLLYILTSIQEIWQNYDLIFASVEAFITYVSAGFVFYGGLFGAAIGVYVYGKQFKVNVIAYIRVMIPAIPLFHLFGRIGCFFTGCCYGIESSSMFAIAYHSAYANNVNAMRIPVQLIEACCNLMLFSVLHTITKKYPHTNKSIRTYLFWYAIVRFPLEFLRGDFQRGVWIFSTSQWISIAILMVLFYLKKRYKNLLTE